MVPLQKLGKVALLQPLSALFNSAEVIFGANFNTIIYSLSRVLIVSVIIEKNVDCSVLRVAQVVHLAYVSSQR